MSRIIACFVVVATLAACGVDGEPIRPSVSGAVNINSGGISPSVGVGVSQGPVSIFLGL